MIKGLQSDKVHVVILFLAMEDTSNPTPQSSDPNAGQGGQQDPQASQPAGGQPPADQGAQPAAGGEPAESTEPAEAVEPTAGQPVTRKAGQKDLSGIMEENVDISSLVSNAGNKAEQDKFLQEIKIPEHPNTKFDDKKFVSLLAGSISLTFTEKKKIIEALPQLSQFQVDELMKIFEEEQQKFTELEKKHAEQVAKLEKEHADNPEAEKAKAEEVAKQKQEGQEAEDIKKSLGL